MAKKPKRLPSLSEGPVDPTDSPDRDESFIPREDLPSLWDGPADFVLRSAEAPLILRPERKVDVVETVVSGEPVYEDEEPESDGS